MKPKKTHLGDQEGLKLANVTEDVTPEEALQRTLELKRCKEDIGYFAEKYFYVLDANGNKVFIKLYPKQLQLLKMMQTDPRLLVIASRQIGKTTAYVIFCVHHILFQQNFNILIAGNKGDTARDNLSKIKDGFESLPNWMKPGIKKWSESKIQFENGVVIKAVTTTPSTGRSGSIDLLILDEFAFVPKNVQNEFWKASLPTVSSRKKAHIVIVSTPNGIGDKFHEVYQLATSGKQTDDGTTWKCLRIDWWERPDRDEHWRQLAINSLGSKEAFDQEYGNSFTVTAGNKLVPDERQLELKKLVEETDYSEVIRKVEPANPSNDKTYIEYFPIEDGHTYIGSADTSEGTGQDLSVFYIFDITEGHKIKLCAKFESAKVIPSEYGKIIFNICKRYGNPLIFIESNAVGVALIDALTKTGVIDYITKKRCFYSNIARYNRKNYQPGIFSHVQTKTKACLNAQKIIQNRNFELILPDKELFNELTYFEKQDTSNNTVYKAAKGKHDDHVLALLWALFAYTDEMMEKYFTVEMHKDEKSGESYPIFIAYINDDIDEIKRKISSENEELTKEERFQLAAKWFEMGDAARANYILQTIFDKEQDDGYGTWNNNPFQLDPSMFSDGLFGERYAGQGRGSRQREMIDEEYGFGFIF